MKDPGKRLKILTNNEIQELYGLPHFFQDEREKYFYLNPLEMEELNNLRSKLSKVYFILQLGYFKAKKMFFIFSQQEVKEDIEYILQQYFPDTDESQKIEVSHTTRLTQQARIMNLYNYKYCAEVLIVAVLSRGYVMLFYLHSIR